MLLFHINTKLSSLRKNGIMCFHLSSWIEYSLSSVKKNESPFTWPGLKSAVCISRNIRRSRTCRKDGRRQEKRTHVLYNWVPNLLIKYLYISFIVKSAFIWADFFKEACKFKAICFPGIVIKLRCTHSSNFWTSEWNWNPWDCVLFYTELREICMALQKQCLLFISVEMITDT